jgi:hypothetical protein
MGTGKKLILPEWTGELGWEVMSWVPLCRRMAQGYDQVMATSFEGMQALYADFATEFRVNNSNGRSLDYPKQYRHDGIYYRYGDAKKADYAPDILIHARGIRRKSSINYRQWPELVKMINALGMSCAFIGSKNDYHQPGYLDLRGIALQRLMDTISASRVVIGVSSGIMHLAAACGANLVVWGDDRTYFGETLEKRYKMTWNPFEVRVGWITASDWQPEPEIIIKKIELISPVKKYKEVV